MPMFTHHPSKSGKLLSSRNRKKPQRRPWHSSSKTPTIRCGICKPSTMRSRELISVSEVVILEALSSSTSIWIRVKQISMTLSSAYIPPIKEGSPAAMTSRSEENEPSSKPYP